MVKTIYEADPRMEAMTIAPGSIDETLNFCEIFGNDNPVEFEIGCGKGRFILAESLERPDVNFVAIERSTKIIRIGMLRAAKEPRPNLRFLNLDADFVVKVLLNPESISAFHVYFPDPWPKDRHHKRRLFNPRLLQKMADALLHKGKLNLKSDHAEYYVDANDRILQSGLFDKIEEATSNESLEAFDEAGKKTSHYEIKWRKESRTIHSAVFQKR